MSMLAGPRRKQKVINLRAKNNAWSNDSGKFGQKMLEKMGWSSGKGLGAKENGIVEHVVAKFKNDEKGLGFEDKNDQWTKHEDDFNALLANLSNDDSKELKLHSGASLETKSKSSKARVHYHKFTRGKDLSRYSEKDLANIFGKKSFKLEQQSTDSTNEDIEESEKKFTEKGSMEDYFKNKMLAFKSKTSNDSNSNVNDDCDEEPGYAFTGFSGTKNDDPNEESANQGFGFQAFANDSTECNSESKVDTQEDQTSERKKKKKKKKKVKDSEKYAEEISLINEMESNEIIAEEPRKRSKKSKKTCVEVIETVLEVNEDPDDFAIEIEDILPTKKKSKKNKRNIDLEVISVPQCDEIIGDIEKEAAEENVPKKKKKRKNK